MQRKFNFVGGDDDDDVVLLAALVVVVVTPLFEDFRNALDDSPSLSSASILSEILSSSISSSSLTGIFSSFLILLLLLLSTIINFVLLSDFLAFLTGGGCCSSRFDFESSCTLVIFNRPPLKSTSSSSLSQRFGFLRVRCTRPLADMFASEFIPEDKSVSFIIMLLSTRKK
ncbi:hypothetical protein DERF_013733 [Dermatophagoides farinae]|uniref:Uncharacterized protein n=1 Tax=Dermatophagoides farinae TaxID=6954 RepID=A0A922KZ03_DERFA|nr:hypothetical protein DERF_013733 [Dermatophagoides farinae]